MGLMADARATREQTLAKLRERTGCTSGTDVGCRSGGRSSSDSTEPLHLGSAIGTVLDRPSINDISLAERLAKRVGYGDNPAKRKALFSRLQKLWLAHREAVEQLVAEAWAQAASARRRDRYFCKAICAKLAESGLELGRGAAGCADAI